MAVRSKSRRRPKDILPEDARIVDEIQRAIGLKVSLVRSHRKPDGGRLSIDFYSETDLQEVFRKLVAEERGA